MEENILTPEQAAQKESLLQIIAKKKWTGRDIMKMQLLAGAFCRLEGKADPRLYNIAPHGRLATPSTMEAFRRAARVKDWLFLFPARAGMLHEGVIGSAAAIDRHLSCLALSALSMENHAAEAYAVAFPHTIDAFADPDIGKQAIEEVNVLYLKNAYALRELAGYNCVIRCIAEELNSSAFKDAYTQNLQSAFEQIARINKKRDALESLFAQDSDQKRRKRKLYVLHDFFPRLEASEVNYSESGYNIIKKCMKNNLKSFGDWGEEELYNIGARQHGFE